MPPPAGGFSAFMLIGILELVGSLALIGGYYTRLAAFVLSGEMAVAYWTAHAPHSLFPLLNFGEAAILFCFVFLYIAAAGPGPWSIDARLNRR
jgi:putative oxidoreductase